MDGCPTGLMHPGKHEHPFRPGLSLTSPFFPVSFCEQGTGTCFLVTMLPVGASLLLGAWNFPVSSGGEGKSPGQIEAGAFGKEK